MWLTLLAACESTSPEAPTLQITVTPSADVPTAARVTWESEDPTVGWVSFTGTDGELHETNPDAAPTRTHDFVVAGLTPDTMFELVGHETTESGDEVVSDPEKLGVGPLPSIGLAVGAASGTVESASWILQGTLGRGEGVVLFDNRGVQVWSRSYDHGRMSTRTRLSADGTTLLISNFDVDRPDADYGSVERVRLDGTELDPVPTPGAHHDFVEVPGGYAYLALDVRTIDDHGVVGDQILEVDAAGNPLGKVWTAFDTWDASTAVEYESFYRQGLDWTHSNTLDYDPVTDEYIVSVRNLSTVLRISRSTGEVVAQIGGDDSTYRLEGGRAFEAQHSPQFPSSDELVVLDNRFSGLSAARGYTLDAAAHTYTETWTVESPTGANVAVLGDVQRDEAGRTLISWGAGGVLEERDQAGVQTFRLDLSLGSAFSFFQPLTRVGGPTAD